MPVLMELTTPGGRICGSRFFLLSKAYAKQAKPSNSLLYSYLQILQVRILVETIHELPLQITTVL